MTRRANAWILSIALATSGGALWAQMGGTPTPGITPPVAAQRIDDLNRPGTINEVTQFEGQLVDLFTLSQKGSPVDLNPGGLKTGATLAPGAGTSEPGLRIERATPGQAPALSPGNSANSGGAMQSSTSGGVSSRVGGSAGTYNAPGAGGGSSDTSAAIGGTARTGNTSTGNLGGQGSGAGIGGTSGTGGVLSGTTGDSVSAVATAESADVKANLTSGIPAAISSGGQTYVLVCDPRQLSMHAGLTVRIAGKVSGSNLLVPSKIEVRDAGGAYRELAFKLPLSTGRTGTALDR